MANLTKSLQQIRQIPGNLGAALVDVETGATLSQINVKMSDLGCQVDAYAMFIRRQEQMIASIAVEDTVEEVVFSSTSQYHLIYPLRVRILKVRPPENLFFFVALSRRETTLAQARSRIQEIIREFTM